MAQARTLYRELAHLIKQMPSSEQQSRALSELRTSFRAPVQGSIDEAVKKAEQKLSFLRITLPKTKPRGQSGRWIYKNGQRLADVNGTLRDAQGKAVSSYDGKNLDPESVSRHRKHLKRLGFVNNAHAKGFF